MGDHAAPGSEILSGQVYSDATAEAGLVEAGRLLFARDITFLRGVPTLDILPPFVLPEICFAGRSNVGKSSLINAVCGRSTVARTSNTPGRTQELNFFDVAGRLIMVDMPGYGFAQAPKDRVEAWTRMVQGYLRGRPTLRRCLMLVDSRHGLKDVDRDMMKLLDQAAVIYQVVLTKIDKLKAAEIEGVLARTREELSKHVAAHPTVLVTSSDKGIGIAELRAEIVSLANPEGEG